VGCRWSLDVRVRESEGSEGVGEWGGEWDGGLVDHVMSCPGHDNTHREVHRAEVKLPIDLRCVGSAEQVSQLAHLRRLLSASLHSRLLCTCT
jgi:hypothetical protein